MLDVLQSVPLSCITKYFSFHLIKNPYILGDSIGEEEPLSTIRSQGLKGIRSQAAEGEASSNHRATSPQQIRQTSVLAQPDLQTFVMAII